MKDYSKRALMEFIETSIKKGWINSNTGVGVRAACRQILEQVADEEDVRNLDVSSEVERFGNRNPGKLSGDSLRVYDSRVRGMIEGFSAFVTDPAAYQPSTRPGSTRIRRVKLRANKAASMENRPDVHQPTTNQTPSHHTTIRASVTEISLTLPFNLRPDFLAQVTVPRDLTKDEAKRLATFIDALALEKTGTSI